MTDAKSKLWGGGFSEAMHPALASISESLEHDLALTDADLRGCAAYARGLEQCGVLQKGEGERLADALLALREEWQRGAWVPSDAEDIHGAIEAEISKRLPGLGERLHTGRSRNDQVSTAFRITLREGIDSLLEELRELQRTLIRRATEELDTLIPSYTHIQRAQPIRLAHWILAQFWPLERDVRRLRDARRGLNALPLGSGAVSGHPFDIDRDALAHALGFERLTENSLDTVGDRDFAIEFCFSASLVAVHLSRLAEELVIWSSAEFGYIQWPDGLATGSSLMPNKKNPDLGELVRGRAAQSIGDVVSLLVLLKGLPSSYQRDLQEDKPPVWRVLRTTKESVRAMSAAMDSITFVRERMADALTDDTLATELADVLVDRGIAFRHAHHQVGQVAAAARSRGVGLKALADQAPELLPKDVSPDDIRRLSYEAAIERRHVPGGTARAAIEGQIQAAREAIRS
ncbi:MAG: argininosuccinate lyase [Myxococcota bacterium]